jgi:serine/threonine-protein kinase HipA
MHGRIGFTYTQEWLTHPQAAALSVSLPLIKKRFNDQQARPFFSGLLPEGDMRRILAKQYQISKENDFALLDKIGGECAGAVTLLEAGQQKSIVNSDTQIEWLDEDKLISILDELPYRPMMAGRDGLRLSLAGVQDKLPVVYDGTRIGLPKNGTPSSHILKPAIRSVKDSVINEAYCMALADQLKLGVAKTTAKTLRGRSFLLIERYDRYLDVNGVIQRLHQEDFCQAIGVVPEIKYQNEGGPGLPQCFDLVKQAIKPSAPSLLRLLDFVIFNALIGNHDAHGKNLSLLYEGSKATLTPYYDLLSTAIYPNLTEKMAMKIGSKYKFTELQAKHWDQFAESGGLSKAQTRKRILSLANKLPNQARMLQADNQFQFDKNELIQEIITLIESRCRLTIDRLT